MSQKANVEVNREGIRVSREKKPIGRGSHFQSDGSTTEKVLLKRGTILWAISKPRSAWERGELRPDQSKLRKQMNY